MSMKLSYRDKVIFIAVVVLIIIVGGFFVAVKPKISESQEIKNTLTSKEEEKQAADDKIATLEPLKQQLDDSIKEVDTMQESFVDEQTDFEADKFIHDLLEPTGIQFRNLTQTREAAGALSEYYYTRESVIYDIKMNADISGDSLPQEVYDSYYGTEVPQSADVNVAVNTVTLEFAVPCDEGGTPDWDMIESVWDTIADCGKTVNITSFESSGVNMADAEVAGSESYQTLTATINIYSIYHMDTSLAK